MLAAGAARAQDSQPEPDLSALKQPIFGADGYYMGVSGVYALEIGGVPRADDVDGSAGASLRLGYRANRWFAAELHGEWFNDFAYEGGGFTAWDLMACGRAYPIRSRLQPFAVAGVGVLQTRDHGTGNVDKGTAFAGRFGIGLDIYINPSLAISMDGAYVIPFTQVPDHDFVAINLGIQWW
jgi:hypothetical protein